MSEVNYFDIILGLSVVHYFNEPFQEVLDTLMSMCSYCFFEHPNKNEGSATVNFQRLQREQIDFSKYNPKLMCETNVNHLGYEALTRKMYLLENKQSKKTSKQKKEE